MRQTVYYKARGSCAFPSLRKLIRGESTSLLGRHLEERGEQQPWQDFPRSLSTTSWNKEGPDELRSWTEPGALDSSTRVGGPKERETEPIPRVVCYLCVTQSHPVIQSAWSWGLALS